MPDEGPIHESDASADSSERQASSIDAVPPRPQAPPGDIVDGFLAAMGGWPIQIGVAKQFLSEEARAAWQPGQAMITFADSLSPEVAGNEATVQLSGAERLDASGAWLGAVPESERELHFDLTLEDGEYRITNPRDALVVRADWFAERFIQVSLYFFDRTGQILVPEPVFVPRGDQLATTLTNRLLEGRPRTWRGSPAPTCRRSTPGCRCRSPTQGSPRSISAAATPDPDPDDLDRMLAQLGWTLRQVPGVRSLRVTIGGEEVRLPGGDSEYGVNEGQQYDPAGDTANSLLYGLRNGQLVYGEPDTLAPAMGPLGEEADHGLRSVSVTLDASVAVGVSDDGTSVLRAPLRDDPAARIRTILSGGADLLPPAWDFTGRLWLVDNTPTGARIDYRAEGEFNTLRVPGVSGQHVRAFLVSRDATRYVAVVRGARGDQLRAGRILFDGQGGVDEAAPSRRIQIEGVDRARISDIAWISPTSVIVLRPVSREQSIFEVRTVAVDGAPVGRRRAHDLGPGGRGGARGRPRLLDHAVRRHSGGPRRPGLAGPHVVHRWTGHLDRLRRVGGGPQGAPRRLSGAGTACWADRMLPDTLGDLLLGSRCVGCARPGRVLCRACAGDPAGDGGAGLAVADPVRPRRCRSRRRSTPAWCGPWCWRTRSAACSALAGPLGRLLAGAVAAALRRRRRPDRSCWCRCRRGRPACAPGATTRRWR